MRPTKAILSLALTGILLAGCDLKDDPPATTGKAPGGSAEEMKTFYTEAKMLLASIKDKKSADEAKPKLVALGENIKKNTEAMKKKSPVLMQHRGATQGGLPETDAKKIAEMIDLWYPLQGEIKRVSLLDDGKELIEAFKKAAGMNKE